MKKLPLHKRPLFSKRILEVGGGHAPYQGVTHAVDKFPGDNSQRAGSMVVERGVTFKEGELEAIPFEASPKFDFIYASHVLEHVVSPAKAVSEMNRVANKGYIETPSPLREQIACPIPFDRDSDFHTLYCWTSPRDLNTLHVIKKSAANVGEFCDCPDGKLAHFLFRMRREKGFDVEPLLPRDAKTTRLYFSGEVRLVEHDSFRAACKKGRCGYVNAQIARSWAGPLLSLTSSRFKRLRNLLMSFDKNN